MADANMNASRERLLEDFNRIVSDAEALLRSMSDVTGETAVALRTSVEENLRATKQRVRELHGAATETTAAAARATDEYVHTNPWTAVMIAAGAGVIVGVLLSGRR